MVGIKLPVFARSAVTRSIQRHLGFRSQIPVAAVTDRSEEVTRTLFYTGSTPFGEDPDVLVFFFEGYQAGLRDGTGGILDPFLRGLRYGDVVTLTIQRFRIEILAAKLSTDKPEWHPAIFGREAVVPSSSSNTHG